ncbi:hypothetical protein [Nitratifractor sp.]
MIKQIVSMIWVFSALQATDLNVSCRGCAAGKLMVQCDIYVLRQGDLTKRNYCEEYAKIVDLDGASAKAAWYYLLAGKPEQALNAAQRALRIGQDFAGEYAAYALLLLGRKQEAREAMKRFSRKAAGSYWKKDEAILRKLYPKLDFSRLHP